MNWLKFLRKPNPTSSKGDANVGTEKFLADDVKTIIGICKPMVGNVARTDTLRKQFPYGDGRLTVVLDFLGKTGLASVDAGGIALNPNFFNCMACKWFIDGSRYELPKCTAKGIGRYLSGYTPSKGKFCGCYENKTVGAMLKHVGS